MEVIHLRGRNGLPESFSDTTFSERQLDEIAPLVDGDEVLGEFVHPLPETIERIKQRIEAARMLKYGR